MGKMHNLKGRRFGRLKVDGLSHMSISCSTGYWNCTCRCGNKVVVISTSLKNGNTKSCGCLRKEMARKTHRKHGCARSVTAAKKQKASAEYTIWRCMLNRCYREKDLSYKWYGKLGVTVHQPWRDSFESFLADVGRRPSVKHSLDRYPNPAGNYEPGNVRWATSRQQRLNRRVRS